MKSTPHLLVAGILVLIAVLATASSLLGGVGGYPIPTRDLRVVGPQTRTDVVAAERATGPLVPELSTSPSSNPFSARKKLSTPDFKIPAPPPPRLDYPALPVLPVPIK